jgi:predicted ATPase
MPASSACSGAWASCPAVSRSRQRRLSSPEVKTPSPGTVLAAAAHLIDKSLLLRAETSVATRPLYRMLETVRAYAALELDVAGERDQPWKDWRDTAFTRRRRPTRE